MIKALHLVYCLVYLFVACLHFMYFNPQIVFHYTHLYNHFTLASFHLLPHHSTGWILWLLYFQVNFGPSSPVVWQSLIFNLYIHYFGNRHSLRYKLVNLAYVLKTHGTVTYSNWRDAIWGVTNSSWILGWGGGRGVCVCVPISPISERTWIFNELYMSRGLLWVNRSYAFMYQNLIQLLQLLWSSKQNLEIAIEETLNHINENHLHHHFHNIYS